MSDWELCKENAQPTKGGRKVEKLVSALSRSTRDQYALEEERITFEESLQDDSGTDPLKRWLEYLKMAKSKLSDRLQGTDSPLRGMHEKVQR